MGDGDVYSIEAAKNLYGADVVEGILNDDGEIYEDHEGNELYPLNSIDHGKEGETCGGCLNSIANCTCSSGLYRVK